MRGSTRASARRHHVGLASVGSAGALFLASLSGLTGREARWSPFSHERVGRGVAAMAAPAASGPQAGIVPPANPPANIPSDPPIDQYSCTYTGSASAPTSLRCTSPCARSLEVSYDDSPACVDAALEAIDRARAAEHVGKMQLPADWYRLTVAEQLFVTADLERVDRGLPPYVGLVRSLDAAAEIGARQARDPTLTPSATTALAYSANWAGDSFSPLSADYGWMYSDGWGPRHFNFDCSTPRSPGCWGHRDDILGEYTGVRCTDCVMGAAYAAPAASGWRNSYTELFVEPATPRTYLPYFTWARNVLPYLARALGRRAGGGAPGA